MSDPGITYRSRDEVSGVRRSRDPIHNVTRLLKEFDLATLDEIKAIEREVRVEVDSAVSAAKEAQVPLRLPARDALLESVYANQAELFVRDCNGPCDAASLQRNAARFQEELQVKELMGNAKKVKNRSSRGTEHL